MVARLIVVMLVLAAGGAEAQTQNNYLDGLRSLDLKIPIRWKMGAGRDRLRQGRTCRWNSSNQRILTIKIPTPSWK